MKEERNKHRKRKYIHIDRDPNEWLIEVDKKPKKTTVSKKVTKKQHAEYAYPYPKRYRKVTFLLWYIGRSTASTLIVMTAALSTTTTLVASLVTIGIIDLRTATLGVVANVRSTSTGSTTSASGSRTFASFFLGLDGDSCKAISFQIDTNSTFATLVGRERSSDGFSGSVWTGEFNECAGFVADDLYFFQRTEAGSEEIPELVLRNVFCDALR